MDFQELKETYMDDAFQKATYDYTDAEVDCDLSMNFPLYLVKLVIHSSGPIGVILMSPTNMIKRLLTW